MRPDLSGTLFGARYPLRAGVPLTPKPQPPFRRRAGGKKCLSLLIGIDIDGASQVVGLSRLVWIFLN